MNINHLFELHELAKDSVKKYQKKRFFYETLKKSTGKHFLGVVGPRGVGKTILLRQYACDFENSFYISLDSDEDIDLFELVKILINKYKINSILLDEVHFLPKYEQVLKKIYDYLNIKVIFTSSVSLSLYESLYDFSRRVKLYTLYPFSFREYIYFIKDTILPVLTIDQLLKNYSISQYLKYEYLFEPYLKGGIYPFNLEEPDVFPILSNILDKILNRDIPSVTNLRYEEIQKIKKLVKYIGLAEVDNMNYSNISRNIGITKYKAEQYVDLLKRSFILNPVFPTGTNVLKEPKILMFLPYRLLFNSYEMCVGPLREDFIVESLQLADYSVNYLKSKRGEKTPDYLIDYKGKHIIIEVGGNGKGREQFKGFKAETKLVFSHDSYLSNDKYPLFLAGFFS